MSQLEPEPAIIPPMPHLASTINCVLHGVGCSHPVCLQHNTKQMRRNVSIPTTSISQFSMDTAFEHNEEIKTEVAALIQNNQSTKIVGLKKLKISKPFEIQMKGQNMGGLSIKYKVALATSNPAVFLIKSLEVECVMPKDALITSQHVLSLLNSQLAL